MSYPAKTASSREHEGDPEKEKGNKEKKDKSGGFSRGKGQNQRVKCPDR